MISLENMLEINSNSGISNNGYLLLNGYVKGFELGLTGLGLGLGGLRTKVWGQGLSTIHLFPDYEQ